MSFLNIFSARRPDSDRKITTFWDNLKPEKAFLACALIFGIFFCFANPPFEAPDETVHFLRAYEVSMGHMRAIQVYGGYGDFIPKSVVFLQYVLKVYSNEPYYILKYQLNGSFQNILKPLNPNQTMAVRFDASATYSPVAYLPQAIGMFAGRILSLSALAIFLLGRLFNLICWVIFVYFAIRLAPFGKWGFFVLALTPMSLYQAASLSPDAIADGVSFLFVALVLHLAYASKRVSKMNLLVLLGLLTLLALVKIPYLPIAVLLFAIPAKKLGGPKARSLSFAAIGLVSLGIGLIWQYMARHVALSATAVSNSYAGYNLNSSRQIHDVLIHPLSYLTTLINALFSNNGNGLITGFFGDLGWVSAPLPLWTIMLSAGVIAFTLVSEKTPIKVSKSVKAICWVLIAVISVLVASAMYACCTNLDVTNIYGIQGRYFIPVSILLIPILANSAAWLQPTKNLQKKVALTGTWFVLLISVCVLLFRFYALIPRT